MAKKNNSKLTVETLTHEEATRKNIPTAEYQSVMQKDDQAPIEMSYPRGSAELAEEKETRNRDLDPQLVWRGKDQQDWSDLVVQAPPLYIQEKVHPKVLIDDLLRQTKINQPTQPEQLDLFADFNGIPEGIDKTEFYRHDQNWSNRMILGDSLQVMASLAERERLRGKVQCIYFDPPYGIKFNSNFQWSTTSRDVKDGKTDHITREPEQVKAFRDTWRDGIHSYLTYLRDRLTVARDLLTDSGSIFVQIGDENVHRVRALMDEVFGDSNSISCIYYLTTSSQTAQYLAGIGDYILWYSKNRQNLKFRKMYKVKADESGQYRWAQDGSLRITNYDENMPNIRRFRYDQFTSQTGGDSTIFQITHNGKTFFPSKGGWKTNSAGALRLLKSDRLYGVGKTLSYKRFFEDFSSVTVDSLWTDTRISGFGDPKFYVVQIGKDADGKPVDYGSVVEAGTVLARIDDSLYQADTAQAEAQVQSARASLQRAKADLDQIKAKLLQADREWKRAKQIGPSEALAQASYDAYETACKAAVANVAVGEAAIAQAKATIDHSEAALRRTKRNLGYCTIKSPVNGVIIDRRVNIGQTVVASLNARAFS